MTEEFPLDPDMLSEQEFKDARRTLGKRILETEPDSEARVWTEDALRRLHDNNPGHSAVSAFKIVFNVRRLTANLPEEGEHPLDK